MGVSKNLKFTASSQVISFFFLLGFSVLVARLLGPEGQGEFTLLILIPTILARFGHLGFDASFAYYAEDERFKYGVVFSIWFFLVLSFLFLCTIFIAFYNSSFYKEFTLISSVLFIGFSFSRYPDFYAMASLIIRSVLRFI